MDALGATQRAISRIAFEFEAYGVMRRVVPPAQTGDTAAVL